MILKCRRHGCRRQTPWTGYCVFKITLLILASPHQAEFYLEESNNILDLGVPMKIDLE